MASGKTEKFSAKQQKKPENASGQPISQIVKILSSETKLKES